MEQTEIAKAVTKVGGGHPKQRAISYLQASFRNDPEWHPGKRDEVAAPRGPKRKFTGQKQQAVAKAAMALKQQGVEPTANAIRERCPKATYNEEDDAPFSDNRIYEVLKTQCYDPGSEEPWGQFAPLHRTALSPELKRLRLAWASAQEKEGNPPHWFLRNVIYLDPSHTILTDRMRSNFDEEQAAFGKKKRWMSPDTKGISRNLLAPPYATKQAQYGDKKIWWFIVLFRGYVHFEIMDDTWTQTGAGMSDMVDRLEGILKKRLGRDVALPRIILSDRGPGFYQSSTGHIVGEYHNALKRNGFRSYAGTDAGKQPPDMPDVFPHETAMAWARAYFKKHPLKKGGGVTAMEEQLRTSLKECAAFINSNYDVEGLCSSFPARVKELRQSGGERLSH